VVKAWPNAGSYRISIEPDGNGGSRIVGKQLKPLPGDLGLVIGDALQAMRSSLDNLAFALAAKSSPSMTAKEEEDVSFPINDMPAPIGHRSIKHMGSIIGGEVVGFCPDPAVSPIQEHPLWILNKMNNRDKHRAITVAAFAVAHYSMSLSGTMSGPGFIGPGGPQHTKDVGDAVVFASFGPGSQIQTNLSASLQIVFDQGVEASNREVSSTLRWFHDHIRDVVFQGLEQHL